MSQRVIARVLVALASAAAVHAGGIRVTEGPVKYDLKALSRRGTYVRDVFVEGVPLARVIRALHGPANGPLGFAPGFVSETPVRAQVQGDRVVADRMRIKGAPAAAGSDVRGRFTGTGMEAQLSGGMVTGWFKIDATRLLDGPEGSPRVLVREVGSFTVLQAPPRSLLGIPVYALANFTPMGWMMQAMGGRTVAAGHVALFELRAALEARLLSGLPQYE